MSKFFLTVLNMSISASWLVLAVLLLRLVVKKAPKWVSVLLWGFVAFRLICPFSFESVLSLIPSAQTISPDIMMDRTPEIHTGITSLNSVINPVISEAFTPDLMDSANPLQIWIPLAALVWGAGIAAMLIYTAISYTLLRRKVATAVLLRDNIYQSENVDSPFVLGIIKPKIYLPFQIDEQNLEYVIAHEVSHIRRKDHWWKPFGFALLALHWFNPLLWLGYILLCRDIELACDEKVIKQMDSENRADYTLALVACSVHRRSIAACPLAFGEIGVKERIKSVMNYRKPTFWIIVTAVVLCAIVAVCFLTNPVSNTLNSIEQYNLEAVTQEKTTVFVSDGEYHSYIGGVDREELTALYNIQISQDEISQDRSDDRDKSHTLILNLPPEEPEEVLMSYIKGTYIHFNADFTQVWVNDGVKSTLSYKVLEPEKARFIFLTFRYRIPNQDIENLDSVETVNGNLKTYYKNTDGTWQYDGITYQHRLEITGRMSNAAIDSTFVYLSNLETITFSQAWKAAGLSSNLSDYFSPEEAVLVEWYHGTKLSLADVIVLSQKGYDLTWSDFEKFYSYATGSGLYIQVYEIDNVFEVHIAGSPPLDQDGPPAYINLVLSSDPRERIDIRDGGVMEFISRHSNTANNAGNAADQNNNLVVKPETKKDAAISEAIRSHYKNDKPDGLLHTESHMILVDEVASGTPLAGHTGHIREETVYVYYLHMRFNIQGDRPEEHNGIYGQAAITFTVDENETYTLKYFIKPESSADSGAHYASELINKFVCASEDIAENEEKYSKQLLDSCWTQATSYLENLKTQVLPQPGETVHTPLLDGVSYDIDGDGKQEMCTLTYGPTSGLFSFCFYASPMEATASSPKYSETFVLTEAYQLSFDFSENQKLRIKGEHANTSSEPVYFDIGVKDGQLVLQSKEDTL